VSADGAVGVSSGAAAKHRVLKGRVCAAACQSPAGVADRSSQGSASRHRSEQKSSTPRPLPKANLLFAPLPCATAAASNAEAAEPAAAAAAVQRCKSCES
jgi:hypothetical protein